MSEFKKHIEGIIQEHINRVPSTVKGRITEYSHSTKMCTVEITNLTGGGKIQLQNRIIPDSPKGVVPGGIRENCEVLLNIPGGQYTYATIVEVYPPNGDYTTPDRITATRLPRQGTTISSTGILRP